MISRRGFLGTLIGAALSIAGGVVPKVVPRTARDLSFFRFKGIDTTMAEEAGRRVAEEIERCILGLPSKYVFAKAPVTYEYVNFPSWPTSP